jgi:membrane associated rhomboid family serine protease
MISPRNVQEIKEIGRTKIKPAIRRRGLVAILLGIGSALCLLVLFPLGFRQMSFELAMGGLIAGFVLFVAFAFQMDKKYLPLKREWKELQRKLEPFERAFLPFGN